MKLRLLAPLVLCTVADLVELCEWGRHCEAAERLDTATTLSQSERLFIRGGIDAFTGSPSKAKDLLSKAARELPEPWASQAETWLTVCYWRTGEAQEAVSLTETVLSRALEPRVRFQALLAASVVQADLSNYSIALGCLDECEDLVENVNPVLRGKFHNQRALVLRRSGQDIDRVICEYEAARYFFEQASDVDRLANVAVNLSRVFCEAGMTTEAHEQASQALETLRESGFTESISRAYDERARAFLKEDKRHEAVTAARESVRLIEQTEREAWLAESLLTLGSALSRLRENEGQVAIERACAIYGRLGDAQGLAAASMTAIEELLLTPADCARHYLNASESPDRLRVAKAGLRASERIGHASEVEHIRLVLHRNNGEVSKSAVELKLTHTGLIKKIDKYADELSSARKPRRHRSIIRS